MRLVKTNKKGLYEEHFYAFLWPSFLHLKVSISSEKWLLSLKTTKSTRLWPSSDGLFSVINSDFASKSNKSCRFQPRLRIRRPKWQYYRKASWQLRATTISSYYSATKRDWRTRVGAFDRARRGLFDYRREIWRRGSRDPRRHPKLPPACEIFVKKWYYTRNSPNREAINDTSIKVPKMPKEKLGQGAPKVKNPYYTQNR